MTALLANIDFEMVPISFKAVMALTMLGGCALLALIAILAAVKQRPGIAAFAGGLLALGLVLPAGALLSYVSLRSDVMGHTIHNELPTMRADWADMDGTNRLAKIPIWPRIGILVIIGVAITVITGLSRRSTTRGEGQARRSWWPVLLVPAIFVFAAPLFFMSFVPHRAVTYSRPQAPPQPPVPLLHFERPREILSREAKMQEAELHRRIAKMNIHQLMDLFDAPRIVISAPSKATIPILSNLPHPISVPVKSVTILLAAAESSEDSASSAAVNSHVEAQPVLGQDDKQLLAEAGAAVRIIAEAEEAGSHASVSDAKNEIEAEWESSSTVAEKTSDSNVEAELSTPIATARPKPKIEQPPPPKWIASPPQRIDDVRREVFVTHEWATEKECEYARDIGLMLKVYDRIQWLNGGAYQEEFVDSVRLLEAAGNDQRIHDLHSAGITVPFIHQEMVKDQYFETVERSFGPMKKLYTLIEFNPNIDRQLRQYWDAFQRQERFAVVGAGAGGVLGLLGLCYGLLKVDTWTKGYYTKRLFLGVPAAIIGIGTLLAAMILG